MRTSNLSNAESIQLYKAISNNEKGLKTLTDKERRIVKIALDNLFHRSINPKDIGDVRVEIQAIINKLEKGSKNPTHLKTSHILKVKNKILDIFGFRPSDKKIESRLDKIKQKKSNYELNQNKLNTINLTIKNIKNSLNNDTNRALNLQKTITEDTQNLKTDKTLKSKIHTDKFALKGAKKTISSNKRKLKKLKNEKNHLIKTIESEKNKIAHIDPKTIPSLEGNIQKVLKNISNNDQRIKDLYKNEPKMEIKQAEQLMYIGAKENPKDPNNKTIINKYESKIEKFESDVKEWKSKIKEIKKSMKKEIITLRKLKNQQMQVEKQNEKFLKSQINDSKAVKNSDLENDWKMIDN